MKMALTGVSVSIEAVQENQIQEVTLDGHEILVPPLSMSECLAKSAQKIDFTKDESEDKGKPTSEGETEDAEKELAAFQPSLWPWDSVRNQLKAAFTEMSVLLDVLNIAKEKQYLVLAHVAQDVSEPKSAMQLMAKKKGLSAASSVLMSGAERLKKSQLEAGNRSQNEFHIELLKLRQNWRLKKVGNAIIGDLSYRSAGSRFWQGGTFEVTKNTNISTEAGEGTVSNNKSALEVVIPSELEGLSFVQVEVKTVSDSMDLTSATLRIPDGLGKYPQDAHWQTKLQAAQNVLFCKELFAQLAREAVQLKSTVPLLVVGNQIITNIFPKVQLSIVLYHSTGSKDKKQVLPPKPNNNHVLEHSLHQLLREVHYKTLHMAAPHPVTSAFGVTKRRRLAGPMGMSRTDLKSISEIETLLEQIIRQSRHDVLRQRTMTTIDRLAQTIPDPQIMAHWSCLNSPLQSNVKIIITSQAFEGIRPTWQSLDLEIGVDKVQVVTKDRRTMTLSFEEKEIEDVILWQISQHHVSLSQNLGRLMGWELLSYNGCSGVGQREEFATASSVQLVSPNSDRMLAVRSGPTTGLHVYLKVDSTDSIDPSIAAMVDPKWQNLGGVFKEVDLEQIEGKNFASKLEVIMAMVHKKR